jgi:hypothetical protein
VQKLICTCIPQYSWENLLQFDTKGFHPNSYSSLKAKWSIRKSNLRKVVHGLIHIFHRPRYGFLWFEVFMAMSMKNAVFWDVTTCGSCKNRRFGGMYRLHYQGKNTERSQNNISSNKYPVYGMFLVKWLFVRFYVFTAVTTPILIILMKEALRSSGTSVLTRAMWRSIPEKWILQVPLY